MKEVNKAIRKDFPQYNWKDCFSCYDVPEILEEMVGNGDIFDLSWGNDASPSFGWCLEDESELRIWANHPDAEKRECAGSRFEVTYLDENGEASLLYDGESVESALVAFRNMLKSL